MELPYGLAPLREPVRFFCNRPVTIVTARLLQFPPEIDRQVFLSDYWQKRPLLIRHALPPDAFLLDADELAGLACESEFESRLIIESTPNDWTLRHGPFEEQDFAKLPENRWTLLVQDVDKFIPEVAELFDYFDFVPSWRIDDIMISYASDRGGVGPHSDNYDVFLMQAKGRRRWRLSYRNYSDDDLLPGLEQRILAHFDTDDEWVLEPGDVLYLPPGLAHWGIAEGECMTYSLGFRAPNQQEVAAEWFQYLVGCADNRALRDPDDLDPDNLGEISQGAQIQAADLISILPNPNSDAFRHWLGRYLTEPKPQFQLEPPDRLWQAKDLHAHLSQQLCLIRHPFARLGWSQIDENTIALFCNGDETLISSNLGPLINLIVDQRRLLPEQLLRLVDNSEEAAALLTDLHNLGALEPQMP